MRRKPGALVGVEPSVLEAAAVLQGLGVAEWHGYLLAKELQELGGTRRLVAHGTLYKALDRLESAGLLESRWEDPVAAAEANRPRRRLFRLTTSGSAAVAAADRAAPAVTPVLRPEGSGGWAG